MLGRHEPPPQDRERPSGSVVHSTTARSFDEGYRLVLRSFPIRDGVFGFRNSFLFLFDDHQTRSIVTPQVYFGLSQGSSPVNFVDKRSAGKVDLQMAYWILEAECRAMTRVREDFNWSDETNPCDVAPLSEVSRAGQAGASLDLLPLQGLSNARSHKLDPTVSGIRGWAIIDLAVSRRSSSSDRQCNASEDSVTIVTLEI
jgi:hypothetical protein